MKLTVNGEQQQLPDAARVADLVTHLGLTDRPCAVEVNRKLVPRREHDHQSLAEGDIVEIVTLVGGG